MRNLPPRNRLRRASPGVLVALLLFVSLGFRGCPVASIEPRPRETTDCPPGTTPAGNGLCTMEFDTHQGAAPVLCPTQGCVTPTPTCTACR
jgi:hypothetical protein